MPHIRSQRFCLTNCLRCHPRESILQCVASSVIGDLHYKLWWKICHKNYPRGSSLQNVVEQCVPENVSLKLWWQNCSRCHLRGSSLQLVVAKSVPNIITEDVLFKLW
ncbi:hypothetical protein CDAR_114581 [Caerostris darwini]|uniref:Uncharacterized protein n=1 Tax=Caerostris darwini TaxID=1538125 RepID=A0AAV4R3I1_9ARAC|nr:hypothetical protein CDAR_114581 [Caerostris darwini]